MHGPVETVAEAAGRLSARFGDKAILAGEANLSAYFGDMMYRRAAPYLCDFRPASTAEAAEGLKAIADLDLELLPRGGGSGLAGGATPPEKTACVVVSTERMRAIRSVDRAGRVMIAEAGVVLADAQSAARDAGLHLGLTHGGAGSATLGGSVATNAGGANVLRYGMARDQLLAIEAVLPCGTIIGHRNALWKDNTGYSLTQLLAGSEGTLAFITAVALKLRSGAVGRQAALFAVSDPQAALGVLELARDCLGDAICAAELMSGDAVQFAARMGCATSPLAGSHDWLLLIEAESQSPFLNLAGGFDALVEAAFAKGLALDGTLAQSEAQRLGLWRLREGIAEAMDMHPGPVLRTDCSVPVGAVPAFIAQIEDETGRLCGDAFAVFFGHIGDGNIHVNFLPRAGAETLPAVLSTAVEDIAVALDGSISAEHGIGLHKRAALARIRTNCELGLMARIKAAFDPQMRLNPGKIFIPPHPTRGNMDKDNV